MASSLILPHSLRVLCCSFLILFTLCDGKNTRNSFFLVALLIRFLFSSVSLLPHRQWWRYTPLMHFHILILAELRTFSQFTFFISLTLPPIKLPRRCANDPGSLFSRNMLAYQVKQRFKHNDSDIHTIETRRRKTALYLK